MKTVTTREAQHHLSRVLDMVDKGEEIIITRRGKPVAKISNIKPSVEEYDEVDWSQSISRIRKHLSDIPKFEQNIILELREEERY
jgi:prevent-host-death family protein